jgi:hypothetical protein
MTVAVQEPPPSHAKAAEIAGEEGMIDVPPMAG